MIKNNCQEIETMLDAYHDGEASAAEREIISQHIANCGACQHKLQQIQLLVSSLKSLPKISAPRDFGADLEGLLAKKPVPRKTVVRPLVWGSIGIAAAVALVLVNLGTADMRAPVSGPSMARIPSTTSQEVAQQNAATPDQSEPGQESSREVIPSRRINAIANSANSPQVKQTAQAGLRAQQELASGDAAEDDVTYVALNDGEQASATEAMGISTDEDGLYAIKL